MKNDMILVNVKALVDELIVAQMTLMADGNWMGERLARIFIKIVKAHAEAKPVDAEPVRHGRWEWYEEPYDSRNPDGDYGWRCSCCKQDLANELSLGIPKMHYTYGILDDPDNPPTLKRCLFCGAKMDGDA